MNVVGLDLALGDGRKTGTGVAGDQDPFTLLATGDGPARLRRLRDDIVAACHNACRHFGVPSLTSCRCFAHPYGVHPDLVAIEGYSYASPNVAHKLGELGGIVRVELFELAIPYIDIPPSSVKVYSCGKGNASKDDVLLAAVRRLGYGGNSKDQADALWVRAAAMAALGEPVADVPQAHQRALVPICKALRGTGLVPVTPLT